MSATDYDMTWESELMQPGRWITTVDENDKMHSFGDNPAFICARGHKFWYKHGVYHRENGPAIIWCDGKKNYFLDGAGYSKEEWQAELDKRSAKSPKVYKINFEPEDIEKIEVGDSGDFLKYSPEKFKDIVKDIDLSGDFTIEMNCVFPKKLLEKAMDIEKEKYFGAHIFIDENGYMHVDTGYNTEDEPEDWMD
jgi:hypothetical protein